MMNPYASLFASFTLLSAVPSLVNAQPDLVSRIATYNSGGLVSMGAEMVYDEVTNTSNYSPEQNNLVLYNGTYYHAFTAYDGDHDIYLRTSTDGLNWGPPVEVSDDTVSTTQAYPGLVVYDDGGNTVVVVCWDDRRESSAQLRMATSMDGGTLFTHSIPVSTHTDAVYIVGNIAVDAGGKLYAGWSRHDGSCLGTVYISTSTNNGMDWSTMAPIFSSGCFTGNHVHVTAGGPDSVMVAVSEDQFNHTNIIAVHSTDGGLTFTPNAATTYSGFQTITAFSASVAQAGRIHMAVTYGETTGSVTNIVYVTSTDWGQTWSAPVAANDITALFTTWAYQSLQSPSIAFVPGSGNIYISWSDQRAGTDNFDVYLSRSTDDGVTWDTDQMVNLVNAPLNQGSASIVVDDLGGGNENVVVTWNDDRFAVSVPEMTAATGSIHPVPAQDRITVDLPLELTGPIRSQVIDAQGSIVQEDRWNSNGTQNMDVSGLRPGMYVLRLVSANGVVAMPWIKE